MKKGMIIMDNIKLPIPENLKQYVEIKDNIISLKQALPEELKQDYENLKEDEFEYYCTLYKEKFGKYAYIAVPSGTRERTIKAIKICLEKNEDLLDEILYPNFKKDMKKGIRY